MNRQPDRNFPVDRQRSVFVGNISYDVSEEQLKDVFSKVGTVVHLRLVHDRETGKPKGYGFCEFTDIKSAELAIRNLNGHELNGRQLRVDSAAGDNNRGGDEGHGPIVAVQHEESPYGKECDPKEAPEMISRSVASLPPEKMFQLMKQMKEIVISNSGEAKNLLLQNPQLAYALLQAQVVMRIVDPQVAMTMLHREVPVGATGPFHQGPAPAAAHSSYGTGSRSMPPPPVPSSYPPQHPQGAPGFMPPGYGGPPPPGPGPMGGPPNYGAPPPGYGGAGGQPPFGQPPPTAAGSSRHDSYSNDERDSAQLLLQVMNLTEEEIRLLPADDREKIMTLRTRLKDVRD